MKRILHIDYEWIFVYALVISFGFIFIHTIHSKTKEIIKNKHGYLGYKLYKQTISYKKAFWETALATMQYPFGMAGITAMLMSFQNHELDAFILCCILLLPPWYVAIKKTLKELEKEAEKEYK